MVFRQQKFRRIAHLSETSLLHLINSQFRSTSEAILDATKDAIHIMLVTLKLNDGIDNMFQYLRTRQGSFLIDMSDKDDRDATRLGKSQQGCRTLPHLRHATRTAIHVLGGNRLNGVDDHDVRSYLLDMREYLLQGCLA